MCQPPPATPAVAAEAFKMLSRDEILAAKTADGEEITWSVLSECEVITEAARKEHLAEQEDQVHNKYRQAHRAPERCWPTQRCW